MTLDEVTAKIDPLIERAERALARLYTVAAEIPFNTTKRLRYGKHGSEWRLMLVGYESEPEQMLVTSSRGNRIHALANLPFLVVQLDAEAAAQAANARRVVAVTEALLAELEARP